MPSRIRNTSNGANFDRLEARTIYYPRVSATADLVARSYDLNLPENSAALLLLVHVGDQAALARMDQIRTETPLRWLDILPKDVIVEAVDAALKAIVKKILELKGIEDPEILEQHLEPYRTGHKTEIWTIPDAPDDDPCRSDDLD